MLLHSSLFLEIWVSCRDAWKLKKAEVGKIKLLLLLRADVDRDKTTACFYSFGDISKAELSVL